MTKKKILIVEDSMPIAEMVKQYLLETRKDLDVLLSYDGEDGLEKVSSYGPDLVILDINLPKMDGLEVYKNMIKDNRRTKVPVIFLSIRDELSDVVKGIGAVDFINKNDFDYDLLTSKIDEVFGETDLLGSTL